MIFKDLYDFFFFFKVTRESKYHIVDQEQLK